MDFQQVLNNQFPNTVSESDFVGRTYDLLQRRGFSKENAIACVGVCRDEITSSLVNKIHAQWGEAFNFSSLGGMLFLGKTGFLAAHHHAPVHLGRERYVYFAFAHIAIDAQGTPGVCYRPGRPGASGACGALIAFRKEMLGKGLHLEYDPADVEQSLLKQRLFRKIKYGEVPDLVSLTKIAHEVILEDLEFLIAETVNEAESDFAVLSGIQIHGPDREQYIWPGVMYTVTDGKRSPLTL